MKKQPKILPQSKHESPQTKANPIQNSIMGFLLVFFFLRSFFLKNKRTFSSVQFLFANKINCRTVQVKTEAFTNKGKGKWIVTQSVSQWVKSNPVQSVSGSSASFVCWYDWCVKSWLASTRPLSSVDDGVTDPGVDNRDWWNGRRQLILADEWTW